MARTRENPIAWHVEALPKGTKKALDFLSGQSWLARSTWYLAGGTALALQVGHRQSVDSEPISKVADGAESAGFAPIPGCEDSIFPSEDRHIPRGKIGPLARELPANPAGPLSRWVLDFFNPSLDFSTAKLIARFKKSEWETSFTKESTVYGKLLGAKVSFIGYPFFVPALPPIRYGTVRVLQSQDIAVMKVIAISQRGKKRDFIDLYWYARNREGLDAILPRLAAQYPETNHNFHHIVRSLMFFEDAEHDPMPRLNFDVTWPEVKSYFRREVPRLTRKLLKLN
jgi:hypothetical protein